ncbi:MAG: hypothetical protein AAGF30_12245 [Pseudomonadota bacterium]
MTLKDPMGYGIDHLCEELVGGPIHPQRPLGKRRGTSRPAVARNTDGDRVTDIMAMFPMAVDAYAAPSVNPLSHVEADILQIGAAGGSSISNQFHSAFSGSSRPDATPQSSLDGMIGDDGSVWEAARRPVIRWGSVSSSPPPRPTPNDETLRKGSEMTIAPMIKGRLSQTDDRPVRGARVTARSADGTRCGAAITDDHGLFNLSLSCLGLGDPAPIESVVFEIEDALGEVLDTVPERFANISQGVIELRVPSEIGERLIPVQPSEDPPFDQKEMEDHLDRLLSAENAAWDSVLLEELSRPDSGDGSGPKTLRPL